MQTPTQSLRSVLKAYMSSNCSDNRDRIFGLQALVIPSERIPVDYSVSWTELCFNVARALLRNNGDSNDAPMDTFRGSDSIVLSLIRETGSGESLKEQIDALYWAFSV